MYVCMYAVLYTRLEMSLTWCISTAKYHLFSKPQVAVCLQRDGLTGT
jgi:hypothetical protein